MATLPSAHRRHRALQAGRRRAAVRVATGRFTPHPGWRNFISDGWRVIEDQTEALRLVNDLVEEQDWRRDKRKAWSAILHALVHHMDWTTGLVTALTLEQLAVRGDRARRTVTRVLAWARQARLLVVVEQGASAHFLGTQQGRTPTYALVTDRAAVRSSPADQHVSTGVDESGALPHSPVDLKPLNRGLDDLARSWPSFAVPDSPSQRTAATRCVLERLGLDWRGVSGLPLWRLRALLKPWWDAGMSPAGLLWAIDHHPDRPDLHRGDALRGGRNLLAVLGHRLAPWNGRIGELPAAVAGQPADYQLRQRRRLQALTDRSSDRRAEQPEPARLAAARTRAKAMFAGHMAALRSRRRADDGKVKAPADGAEGTERPLSGSPSRFLRVRTGHSWRTTASKRDLPR